MHSIRSFTRIACSALVAAGLLASSLLKNACLAFFNLAKLNAKPLAARKITTCVVILASHPCDDAGCRILQQPASRASAASNVLDISKPPYSAAPGPAGAPSTTAAINKALRDLAATNIDPKAAGRVKIPSGDWYIDAPIFMSKPGEELVGDGVGITKLHAADGFRDMSMIVVGARGSYPGAPTQTCNRVPSALDGSVGTRYGVRTYCEFPATNFPAANHSSIVGQTQRGGWNSAASYAINDAVLGNDAEGRELTYVCTKAHGNIEPGKAPAWSSCWVAKLPFVVHLNADPLAAGAKNTSNGRASNWADMTTSMFRTRPPRITKPSHFAASWGSPNHIPSSGRSCITAAEARSRCATPLTMA